MSHFYLNYGKRMLDIALVVCFIVLFSWLIAGILLLYSMTYEFPVFFAHLRIGKNQHEFKMIKFRTLSVDEQLTLNERRFFLGSFLRITNLDELPQLWNVLKGEMSLVGPRPLPVEYNKLFSAGQQMRHTVRPGITGLAQVSGKNSISWDEKFKHDLDYVKHISLRLDCLILLKTLTLALSIKRDVSLEEEKFTG